MPFTTSQLRRLVAASCRGLKMEFRIMYRKIFKLILTNPPPPPTPGSRLKSRCPLATRIITKKVHLIFCEALKLKRLNTDSQFHSAYALIIRNRMTCLTKGYLSLLPSMSPVLDAVNFSVYYFVVPRHLSP